MEANKEPGDSKRKLIRYISPEFIEYCQMTFDKLTQKKKDVFPDVPVDASNHANTMFSILSLNLNTAIKYSIAQQKDKQNIPEITAIMKSEGENPKVKIDDFLDRSDINLAYVVTGVLLTYADLKRNQMIYSFQGKGELKEKTDKQLFVIEMVTAESGLENERKIVDELFGQVDYTNIEELVAQE